MAGNSPISLIVGFPQAPNSGQIGALHRKFQARQDEKLDLINGYSVDLRPEQVDDYVRSLPPSASVMIDRPLFADPKAVPRDQAPVDSSESVEQQPYLSRPEGLEQIHGKGIDGSGVTIAVIDSGIAPDHPDFQGRVKYFKDFSSQNSSKAIDTVGHGTHVAGIAAGDGETLDGIAPKADLVSLRITNSQEAIEALAWAVKNKDKYGIDVLNISLGTAARLPNRQDPFAQATQAAINAGLITVVASGNECFSTHCSGSISTPGILPDAITVGAFDDRGTDSPKDDRMWGRSSNGPTTPDKTAKPDLVAQGVNVYAPSAPKSSLSKARPKWEHYHSDQGSSMATPMVSGSAALLLQVDPSLTQKSIKELLSSTALPLEAVSADAQGSGRLNLLAALEKLQGTDKKKEASGGTPQFDSDRA